MAVRDISLGVDHTGIVPFKGNVRFGISKNYHV